MVTRDKSPVMSSLASGGWPASRMHRALLNSLALRLPIYVEEDSERVIRQCLMGYWRTLSYPPFTRLSSRTLWLMREVVHLGFLERHEVLCFSSGKRSSLHLKHGCDQAKKS